MMTYIIFRVAGCRSVDGPDDSVKRKCGVKILIEMHLPPLVVYSIECNVFRIGSSY